VKQALAVVDCDDDRGVICDKSAFRENEKSPPVGESVFAVDVLMGLSKASMSISDSAFRFNARPAPESTLPVIRQEMLRSDFGGVGQ